MIRRHQAPPRRAMILLVVLSLLTLFAIIGIAFVFYASSAADSARIARDEQTTLGVDFEPEQAMAYFLNQLIFDVNDDPAGATSALRGHSLLRNMFGARWIDPTGTGYYTYTDPTTGQPVNRVPFNGTGRLHYTYTGAGVPAALQNQDDWALINYTYFLGDGFSRDPEHYTIPQSPSLPGSAGAGTWVGGYNVPYTYPDQNNLFLGAMRGDGLILAHSFHRLYTGFGSLAPTNPNWTSADPSMKYKVLRPRPAEHPNFPLPEDAGGDIKNVVGGPGYFDPLTGRVCNNDSFWIDLGAPVMTAPDGRKFKMLFAPFIMDLDGRLNVNVHGNILGKDATTGFIQHVSNQGTGPWAVNLSAVLNNTVTGAPTDAPEWPNLFIGNPPAGTARFLGRYGPDRLPTPAAVTVTGSSPHLYAQMDVDECDRTVAAAPTGPYTLPTAGALFPTFPAGYGNGGPAVAGPPPTGAEYVNHPRWYNVFNPTPPSAAAAGQYDRRFSASNMERLLRFGDAGSPALVSELELLCPKNFNDPANAALSAKRRRLVTTHSADLDVPGLTPWVWSPAAPPNPNTYAYATPPGAATVEGPPGPTVPLPVGSAIPSPAVNPAALSPPANTGEFGADWRGTLQYPGLLGAMQTSIQVYGWGTLPTDPAGTAPHRILLPIPDDLNRRVDLSRPYLKPNASGGLDELPLPPFPAAGYSDPTARFDLDATTTAAVYQEAVVARQQMAERIFRRLVALAGLPVYGGNPAPDETVLAPRRYLAQLAVNIVDYIDDDDISTAFNFYSPLDATGVDITLTVASTTSTPAAPENMPAYWVFGTELPRLVVNEAIVESDQIVTAGAAPRAKTWVELMSTMPATAPATTQQGDVQAVPLGLAAAASIRPWGNQPFATYRIELSPGLSTLAKNNNNALGTANAVHGGTTGTEFTAPVAPATTLPAVPAGQKFLLIGSNVAAADAAVFTDPFTPAPAGVTMIRSDNFDYKYDTTTGDAVKQGVTVLLRKLANHHIPPDTNIIDPTTKDFNLWYNPYLTTDYLDRLPYNEGAATTIYKSRGKVEPYAARTILKDLTPATPNSDAAQLGLNSPVQDQVVATPPAAAPAVIHTFGAANNPTPATTADAPAGTVKYDWLTHLDRTLVSPAELLHVSGYAPYLLTQQFMLQDLNTTTRKTSPNLVFQHRAPWFDQTKRLYRLLEYVRTTELARGNTDPVTGNPLPGNRITGKVNANAIWDPEIFLALCDPNVSNYVNNAADVITIYNLMMQLRSPTNGVVDPNGQAAFIPGPTDLDGATIAAINQGLTGDPNKPFALPAATPAPGPNRPFLSMATGFVAPKTVNPGEPQYAGGRGLLDTFFRPADPSKEFANPADPTAPYVNRLFEKQTNDSSVHPYQRYELLTKIYGRLTQRSNVFAVWVTVGFFEVEDDTTTPVRLGREIGKAEGRNVRHRMFAIIDRTPFAGPPWNGNPGPQSRFDPRAFPDVVPHFSIID